MLAFFEGGVGAPPTFCNDVSEMQVMRLDVESRFKMRIGQLACVRAVGSAVALRFAFVRIHGCLRCC